MTDSNDANDKDINEPEIKEEEESKEVKEREEVKETKEEEEPKKAKEQEKAKETKEGEESKERKQNEEEEEDFAVIPPNGGWGWVVVLAAFYCNVVVDGIQLTFGIFLKAISGEFHAESSEVALAGSLMFGVHLLMGPVCSGCNSAFGLRPVTITGCLICCFGVGISYFATGYWFLYFSFGVIGGVGLGLVYMNTLVITSLYFTTLMPIAIAMVVCGTGIGTMVFAGLGSLLLRVTTWQNSFLMQAALAGSMSFAALSFKPLKPVKVKITNAKKSISDPGDGSGTSSSKRRSIFIKTDAPAGESFLSVRTYQNLAVSFAEVAPEGDFVRESPCTCSRCCRKKKKVPELSNVLLLTEVSSGDPQSRRKSYIEKVEEEEKEIVVTERRQSTVSHRAVFTRVEMKPEEMKRKFWKTLKQTLVTMLDCRLLTSCSFFIFTVSGAINLAAFLIVFIYEKDRCEDLGFSEETSIIFVIALGGVNVFWRLLLGGIAIIPKVHYWALAISGMVIGGVGTMVSGYNSNIYFQFAFCFVFGLAMASFAVFRMPLLIDLVGMDFLENAAGINLLFMGVFCIVFPPIFGWIKEVTNSYNVIFMITGSLIVISALMLIRLKKVDVDKIKKKNTIANR